MLSQVNILMRKRWQQRQSWQSRQSWQKRQQWWLRRIVCANNNLDRSVSTRMDACFMLLVDSENAHVHGNTYHENAHVHENTCPENAQSTNALELHNRIARRLDWQTCCKPPRQLHPTFVGHHVKNRTFAEGSVWTVKIWSWGKQATDSFDKTIGYTWQSVNKKTYQHLCKHRLFNKNKCKRLKQWYQKQDATTTHKSSFSTVKLASSPNYCIKPFEERFLHTWDAHDRHENAIIVKHAD